MPIKQHKSCLQNLVFIHIPKTAGLSLHHELEKYFGRTDSIRFGDEEGRARFLKSTEKELRRYSYITGHISLEEVLNKNIDYPVVAVVRNPLERLVSLWSYHRKSNLSAHKNVKFNSIISFINHRIQTGQVNMGCWYFSHSKKFKSAVDMIRRHHIYVTPLEYYDDFLKTLSELLGASLENVHINVTPKDKPVTITDSDRQLLQLIIGEEQKLFEYVRGNYELLKREFIENTVHKAGLMVRNQTAAKEDYEPLH